ncbi:MAG: hypothetical protein ACREE0_19215 [Phenylobacterium sp.]
MFYTEWMTRAPANPKKNTLTLKLGSWLEANATGWGIVAIPVVILLLLVAAKLGVL